MERWENGQSKYRNNQTHHPPRLRLDLHFLLHKPYETMLQHQDLRHHRLRDSGSRTVQSRRHNHHTLLRAPQCEA